MRYHDWQTRLANHLLAVQKKPFEWGVHDCALFACDSIHIITGKDPAVSFRGLYHDKRGAYVALKNFAGGGLAETAEKICNDLGFAENEKNFFQRGDVALCDQGGEDALGIIDFSGQYVMIAAEQGMMRKTLDCVKRSWRVE